MNITPNKIDHIFRPNGEDVLNSHEINQIIAEIMSVINWAQLIPTDDPNAPQMVEALQAMLYSKESGEALELLTNTLAGKKVLIHNGTDYAYIDFKDLNNDTQALVDENALDEKIAAAISGVLHFVGYVWDTEPPDAKEGELWIVSDTMPTTFPVAAQKMVSGEWVDVEYSPSIFDLLSLKSDDHGYYWFGDMWNLLDFDIDLSQYYTKTETDELLADKQRKLIPGTNVNMQDTSEGVIINAEISDQQAAPKNMLEVYRSNSALAADNIGAIPAWTGAFVGDASTKYKDFYNNLKNNHPELITNLATYNQTLSTWGEVYKYVLDVDTSGNPLEGAILFPKIKNPQSERYLDWANIQTQSAAPTSTSKFTAPSDGVYFYKIGGSDQTVTTAWVNGISMTVSSSGNQTANKSQSNFQLKKGDTVYFDQTQWWAGYFVPYAHNDTTFYYWISVTNAQVKQSVEVMPPANYTTPIPLAEKILLRSRPSDNDLVGKLVEGSTVTSATYPALISYLEADYQAGTDSSETIFGVGVAVRIGASGKRYYTPEIYAARFNLNGNIDDNTPIFARVSADTYILGAVDWTKKRYPVYEYISSARKFTIYSDKYFTLEDKIASHVTGNTAQTYTAPFSIFQLSSLNIFPWNTGFNSAQQNISGFLPTANTTSITFYTNDGQTGELKLTCSGLVSDSVIANIAKPAYYYQVGNTVTGSDVIIASGALNDIAALQNNKANKDQSNVDKYNVTLFPPNSFKTIATTLAAAGTTYVLDWLPNDGEAYELFITGLVQLSGNGATGIRVASSIQSGMYLCCTNNGYKAQGSAQLITNDRQITIYSDPASAGISGAAVYCTGYKRVKLGV